MNRAWSWLKPCALAGAWCLTISGAHANPPGVTPLQAAAQPKNSDRILLTLIEPASVSSAQWSVQATVVYSPTNTSQPGTTTTTTLYSNCDQPATTVFVPVPPLVPCRAVRIQPQDVPLTREQIRQAGEQSLSLDFFTRVRIDQADYVASTIYLDISPCAGDCKQIDEKIDIRCWDNESATEMFAPRMALSFSTAAGASATAQRCQLKNGDYPGWHDLETVKERVRGRFTEADQMISRYLLSQFSIIPKRDGGWLRNATFGWHDGAKVCRSDSALERADTRTRLDASFAWPYTAEVEVLVFRQRDGQVCSIWLDSDVPNGNLTARVRYFYEYDRGELAQVRTEELNDTERRLTFLNGEPFEYVHARDPDSVAGTEDILYWHRDAAREWPQQMNYQPDLKEFDEQRRAASALLKRFAKLPAKN